MLSDIYAKQCFSIKKSNCKCRIKKIKYLINIFLFSLIKKFNNNGWNSMFQNKKQRIKCCD